MPRNSSGTYSLPAGNPVAPNTLIETAWANPTMSDLGTALTDSLDRFGRGSMLAPLKLIDGTVAAPALSFNSEGTSGLFRSGAGAIGVSIIGATVMSITGTAVTFNQPPTWAANPTTADQLVRKSYADSLVAGGPFLPLTGGTLSGPGTLNVNGQVTVTRTGAANTNTFIGWTDTTNSTGYLSVRTASGSGIGLGSDGFIDFSTGQAGVPNAFNQRMRITLTGQVVIGGTTPIDSVSTLDLIGPAGAGQLTIQNGTTVSFFGGGNSTVSVFGTSTNTPLDAYVNGAFVQRWDTAGNAGLGSPTVSNFGHGGTNRIMQITNTGTAVNAQSHVILASGFTGSNASSIGTISWALPAAGSGNTARLASMSCNTLAGHTVGAPSAAITFSTKLATDSFPVDRFVISDVVTYGTREVGYRDLPIKTVGGAYTLLASDRGTCVMQNSVATITVPTGLGVNAVISIYNNSGGSITLAQSSTNLRLAGTVGNANRTLAAGGLATLWSIDGVNIVCSGAGVS